MNLLDGKASTRFHGEMHVGARSQRAVHLNIEFREAHRRREPYFSGAGF